MIRSLLLAGCSALTLLLVLAGQGQADDITKNCRLTAGESQTASERKALSLLEPIADMTFSAPSQQGTDSYTYYFRVCGDARNSSRGGGVVQVDKDGKNTVIGQYSSTQAFRGTDWVMLVYQNGTRYSGHCGKEPRRAMVMISCDRKSRASGFSVVQEERDKDSDCFYLFELDSSTVCPPLESQLSAGSILLIVFFSCLSVYLVGGFLYQRLVVGAKGAEQFPNYTFWQEIGNLTADGCDFVCRSRNREAPPTYRGVASEPLGEEPEERDDHLLPM